MEKYSHQVILNGDSKDQLDMTERQYYREGEGSTGHTTIYKYDLWVWTGRSGLTTSIMSGSNNHQDNHRPRWPTAKLNLITIHFKVQWWAGIVGWLNG